MCSDDNQDRGGFKKWGPWVLWGIQVAYYLAEFYSLVHGGESRPP